MNREIKFRGISPVTNEWVYGMSLAKGTIKRKKDMFFIEVNESWKGVSPKTIGQFTGLKDKNGKEIYEGDILFYNDWDSASEDEFMNSGAVEWDIDNMCFTITNRVHCDIDEINFKEQSEVIGNIHENPELF